MSNWVTHTGGCHCGAVAFEVQAPAEIEADSCNCSMCSMCGFVHLIVPKSRFKLVKGQDAINEYTFNTGVAKHLFCRYCGIKSFYIPRSNPDGFSVNVNCLNPSTIAAITITPFDGQNWEHHAYRLQHLSAE